MAWEWSHTVEAYRAVYDNIHAQPHEWLAEAWSENMANAEERVNAPRHRNFNWSTCYESHHRTAMAMAHDTLADCVWSQAESMATCSNGGHYAYCCEDGCHTVSFSPVE